MDKDIPKGKKISNDTPVKFKLFNYKIFILNFNLKDYHQNTMQYALPSHLFLMTQNIHQSLIANYLVHH